MQLSPHKLTRERKKVHLMGACKDAKYPQWAHPHVLYNLQMVIYSPKQTMQIT